MTLYVVQARGTDDDALARARFVADRFSWAAFVFSWAWLLFHRLWLVLLVWVAAEIAFWLLAAPHLSIVATAGVALLAHLLLGFEAHRLRLAKGARAAALTELVEARDRDEAEAVFFARHRPSA